LTLAGADSCDGAAPGEAVRSWLDRCEVADLLARYARTVDARRWDDLDSVFAGGATIDYTATGGIAGSLGEVKAWLAEAMAAFSSTQHLLGLPVVDVAAETASIVAPCHNPLVVDGRVLVCSLWYHAEAVRTGAGWRISSLRQEKCHMTFLGRD
jgi:hypothetical protein